MQEFTLYFFDKAGHISYLYVLGKLIKTQVYNRHSKNCKHVPYLESYFFLMSFTLTLKWLVPKFINTLLYNYFAWKYY